MLDSIDSLWVRFVLSCASQNLHTMTTFASALLRWPLCDSPRDTLAYKRTAGLGRNLSGGSDKPCQRMRGIAQNQIDLKVGGVALESI
jgi:hypothetical protein